MISFEEIGEILSLYEKHGWTPGRVLLSEELEEAIGIQGLKDLFGSAPVERSDVDALWLSRGRKDGGIAWELRRLTTTPFALCESFKPAASESEIEVHKEAMLARLRDLGD